jgi:signal transduction histidine kinase
MFNAARWRLAFYFAAAFAVIIVLLGGAIMLSARASLYDQVNDDLKDRTERLQHSLRQSAGGQIDGPFVRRFPLEDFQRDAGALGATGYQAALTAPNVFLRTVNYEDAGLPQYNELAQEVGDEATTIDVKTEDGEDMRLRAQPVADEAYIVVARSIEPEQQALRRLLVVILGGSAAGLALACAGGFVLAGRALRPIQTAMDAQRTFVADASHELRTPLSLIRANAEIMKRDASGAGDSEALDDIIKETDHLSYLVGQMLTLARADVKEAPFAREDLDLSALAGDVVREVRVLGDQKHLTITCENTAGVRVRGDAQRLRELLLILLDNAYKYTDEGGSVTVRVVREDSAARLSVADSGRGIPAADQPHIFDRFYRVDKARSRELGGTGLGLAIARWITEAHGGTITLVSEPGRGTTVTVELPGSGGTTPADSPQTPESESTSFPA